MPYAFSSQADTRHTLQAMIDDGKALMQQGRLHRALELFEEVQAVYPDAVSPEIGCAHIKVKLGNFKASLKHLDSAFQKGLRLDLYERERLKLARAEANKRRKDIDAAPDSTTYAVAADWAKLSRFCLNNHLIDDALTYAKTGMAHDPLLPAAQQAIMAAHVALGNIDDVHALFSAWLEHPDAEPELLSHIREAWTLLGDTRFGGLIERGCARWGGVQSVRNTALRLGLVAPHTRSRPLEAIAAEARSSDDIIHETLAMLGDGQVLRARKVCDLAAARPEVKTATQKWKTHHHLMRISPTNDALMRPTVTEDIYSDVIVSAPTDTGKMMLVFNTLGDLPFMPTAVLDRYLAAAGYQAVYLRDFNRVGFTQGIRSLGPSVETSVDKLRALIRSQNISHLSTMGLSFGTFGSTLFGIALQAQRILQFGTVASIEPNFMQAIRDHRGMALRHRFLKNIPPKLRDINYWLDGAQHDYQMDVVYADGHPIDLPHANLIAHHGQVRLHPLALEQLEHNTLAPALATGAFQKWLSGDKDAFKLPFPSIQT